MRRPFALAAATSAALALATAATATAAVPATATRPAASVQQTAATLRGAVDPQGLPTTYHFEYGETTAYGAATPQRGAGRGTVARDVSFRVEGLTPGTTYHYRVVATNADGASVGADRTFRTRLPPAARPTILGTAPFSPYANSVTLTAALDPGGARTSYRFELGTTPAYGLQTPVRTVAAGVQPVSVRVPVGGLQARQTYHFRIVASNRAGTTAGPDTTFQTGPFPLAKLSVRTRPQRQRRSHPYFVTTGVLALPPGVGVADGCQGIVGVRFTSKSRTVASKRMRLRPGRCSYRLRVRALPPAGRDKLRVHVRFYGNAILTPADARSFLVGLRG
jgi:phosphodiesterase/alkaline phosphatase D-like protein